MSFTLDQQAPNVITVTMEGIKEGWESWYLLSTDRHHDHAECDHALERRHLEQAKERGAGIIDGGDLFCAMQGKWDKRADPAALREELHGGNYLNRLVDYAAEFYEPYAKNFVVASPGNHETAILKRHEYNLTQAFCDRLKIHRGSYAGWVKFRFSYKGGKGTSLLMYRHHGYGGGGAVTKGVIQTNRMAVYLPDATFVMTGHTHDKWILPLGRHRINRNGQTYQDEQWHIRCGGYKDEFSSGDGWHVETGKEPKPKGAVWLRFYLQPGDADRGRVSFELTPAT